MPRADKYTRHELCQVLNQQGSAWRSAPGHTDLLDESTVLEDTSEHKFIHCGPDVANIYRSVGLQGSEVRGRRWGM